MTSVMPKGVEHQPGLFGFGGRLDVMTSVMPKGVEHNWLNSAFHSKML